MNHTSNRYIMHVKYDELAVSRSHGNRLLSASQLLHWMTRPLSSLSMRPKNLSWPTKLASLLLYKWFCCTTLRARNPALLSLLRHRKPAILHHEFTFCIFAFCFCLLSIAHELKPNSNRNCILYIKVWLCYWFFNLSIAGGETSKKHSKKLTLSPECDVFWKSGSRAMSTFSRTQCDE